MTQYAHMVGLLEKLQKCAAHNRPHHDAPSVAWATLKQ